MLEFFRKYQTFFFAAISVVIIISFSFFGTYNAIPAETTRDEVIFTSVNGKKIRHSDLEEMVNFLSTDSTDKLIYGGMWGPNFLNDGVAQKDFFQTGLAEILIQAYPSLIEKDWNYRHDKEKRFSFYVHPQGKFLSAESAWSYFAPDMNTNLKTLRQSNDSLSNEAIEARIQLYLAQRQFPATLLRQVLRYQEQQYPWITADPALDRMDLSMFGYHTLEDWFGPRFIRLMSQFIINNSEIAISKGYVVSKQETLADLMRNAQVSYRQNLNSPQLGVKNSSEYFDEQLRRLGLDQSGAVRIWQQVLLSRRLLQDNGNAIVADPMSQQKFLQYAKEGVQGDLYQLPKELRLSDFKDLQKFETYVNAIAKNQTKGKAALSLPTSFLTAQELLKKTPELVQKQYTVEIAQVNKKDLQGKVNLKDTWSWEVDHWDILKNQFPELGIKDANTRDERFAALDDLDDRTRARVDAYAREAIVDQHQEWLDNALQDAEPKQITLSLRLKGGKSFFAGLANREELMTLLDQAAVGEEPVGPLTRFTGDQKTFYRIRVLAKTQEPEILTFNEANKEGVLDELNDKQLEAYYQKIRENHKQDFQKEDGSWKTFADAKDKVATLYYEPTLKAIKAQYTQDNEKTSQQITADVGASLRFYTYTKEIQNKLKDKPELAAELIQENIDDGNSQELGKRQPLANQWKLVKTHFQADRTTDSDDVNVTELFTLPQDGWTAVNAPINGNLYFFQLKKKGYDQDLAILFDKVEETHRLLSYDAQHILMKENLALIKEKNAISLDYLKQREEAPASSEPELEASN